MFGNGSQSSNAVVQYEDQLGKQILPQVSALIQGGNVEAAKQLLQQGLAAYQQGLAQVRSQGGDFAAAADRSTSNQALQNTIQALSSKVGITYAPGVGQVANQGENQQKADLYGLKAPVNQGDPYAMTPQTLPDAAQVEVSPELKAMLSGQGYAPGVVSQMKAKSDEGAANTGQQQLSQAKIALGQAGLAGSPAAAALRMTVARQTGQAQTAGRRDVDINNAQAGMDNQKFGVQQQTGINTTNAAAKNERTTQQATLDTNAKQSNFNELNARYRNAQQALF